MKLCPKEENEISNYEDTDQIHMDDNKMNESGSDRSASPTKTHRGPGSIFESDS
jgi:hypothetical protein